ncbi:hypothetical protein [Lactobacillus gasseri]|jgi:hypothetical protein|uniref:Uncharacterized protein n=1 Tax=Lactobacillus gasseri SV-16A-US TaxID=575604 RepID=A0AB34NYX7_LACGS|nr:hypothetical protein [Lactobacillus gasseri]KFL96370.1 hypothetical protein HMPREF5175_01883 [Lactobacillus gasseri SV-16A-US]MCT7749751.1 hypothetical protein [Lactobacillus gasseri]MCZ3850724.1 hypothetical protein [Lactobacillus gasseri]MCZ3852564.1 hypothetical protein [Lactobacillus gasseri]MCZ3861191.1 hypothetical protein [Lactobacillus gasseri]
MDIRIRNINPKVVFAIDKVLDKFNKKNSTKISRNQFLIDTLEKIPEEDLYKKIDSETAVQLKAMVENMEAYQDAVDKLFFLLITGDTEEALNLSEDLSLKTDKNVGRKINLISKILDAIIQEDKTKARRLNNELKERNENYDTEEGI